MPRKITYQILILLYTLISSSCSYQHIITANFTTAKELNPDIMGYRKPVLLYIYKLTLPLPFKNLPYEKLANNPQKNLGDSLLDYDTLELLPNHHQTLSINVDSTVKYIGLTVGYHDLGNHQHITLIYKININQVTCQLQEHYL